ncbi:MAG: MFS transporter [Acidiferrobacterales bacterium]|nr:MFS transporter [Acidiferrobacterales bacterium]
MRGQDLKGGNSTTWAAVVTVYLAGFLQGLTLVSFPASSSVLKQMHGFSDAQYGAIFLPQVAMAILGALVGGSLAKRLGLKHLLWIALVVNAFSQLALAGSVVMNPSVAFGVVLLGTASLGLGFGLSGAPLNSYPPAFFPERRDTALVALHTSLGVGLASGPLLVGWFVAEGLWVAFPLLLLTISVALALATLWTNLPSADLSGGTAASPAPQERPATALSFWLFATITVLYAFAEGTFSNWAVIYLHEAKQLPEMTAALALSLFWAAMAGGRLLVSTLVLYVAAQRVWLFLPNVMITAFLALPYANSAATGIGLFALAGLACSGFFPLTIGLVSKRFPQHVAWVSSMMIAALMIGVGLGSFIIGPLRQWLTLEQLYQVSTIYPLAALVLAFFAVPWRSRIVLVRAQAQSLSRTD